MEEYAQDRFDRSVNNLKDWRNYNMRYGLLAGITWGINTVVLGIALAMSPFCSTGEAIALAPFISAFLHDATSSIWMLIYMTFKKELKNVIKALKTRSGKFIILGALVGGPIGMSGYVASIYYIGPVYTVIITAIYPAVGAFLSYIFLKEKMKPVQLVGLAVSILGVIALGWTSATADVQNLPLGFLCALVSVLGWSAEAVICAYGMKDPAVSDEHALQIRQVTSALVYGVIILNVLRGWDTTIDIAWSSVYPIIIVAAFFGTASYVFYYKAIVKIGPSKAMALNITYSAWAILFAFLLLHIIPDFRSIICGGIVVCGSIVAASDLNEFKLSKSRKILE